MALLDVMLPRIDGISLTRAIRDAGLTPIVLVSARDHPLDVVGLEAGADDYVTKPFDGPVLAARLRAVLRRSGWGNEPGAEVDGVWRFGELEVDASKHDRDGRRVAVRLTATEARLLTELARNAGIVLARDLLLERVWGYEWGGDTRLVDVHVQQLRSKIGGERIETVRGRRSYKLVR